MKQTTFIFSLIFAAILVSCGDNATKKLVKELNSSYTYDGKEVILTGYVIYNSGALIMNGKTNVALSNSNWQQDAFAHAEMNFGQEPNSIWMPDKFRLEDIEIYDSNGQKHGINTKFNLKGTVHYTNKDWKEQLEQQKEGKKDMFSNNPAFQEMRKNSLSKAEEATNERKKKSGDPNDYSFKIVVSEISVSK